MTKDLSPKPGSSETSSATLDSPSPKIGHYTQTARLHAASDQIVQRKTAASSEPPTGDVHATAAAGVAGAGGAMPYADTLKSSFGPAHAPTIDRISAHVGGAASDAAAAIGAEAFATGESIAFGSTPSLHTAAHEAAHVVQQRGGVQLKSGVGESGDPYEQHADAVADAVVRGESAAGLLAPYDPRGGAGAPAVQLNPDPHAKTQGTPEVAVEPLSSTVKVGEKSRHKLHVTAPHGASPKKFAWGGGIESGRSLEVLEFVDVIDKGDGKAELVVKGVAAGEGEAHGVLSYETAAGHREMIDTPRVRVQVGSHLESAEADLKSIDDRKAKNVAVDEKEETTAHLEAVAASQEGLAKSRGVSGTEMNTVVSTILDDIQKIQTSRNDGYLKAISDLTVRGLNKPADYGSFTQSLIGNLTWALSGLLALTPEGLAVDGFLAFFAAHKQATGTILSTIVGTIGAMTAQFASMPESSGPGQAHVLLQNTLLLANSQLCDQLRSSMYHLIVQASMDVPPPKGVDAQAYTADLMSTVRHLLYGQMWAKGLANGATLDGGAILMDAKNQLLRQFVAANTRINDDGKLEVGPDAENQDTVNAAIGLLKDDNQLTFEPYQLVAEQAKAAASQLGLSVDVDAEEMAGLLAGGKEAVLPVGGTLNFQQADHLFFMGMMDYDPKVDAWEWDSMSTKASAIVSVDALRVSKDALKSAPVGTDNKTAYSANSFVFDATIRRLDKLDQSSDYDAAPIEKHPIRYKADVFHGYKGSPF